METKNKKPSIEDVRMAREMLRLQKEQKELEQKMSDKRLRETAVDFALRNKPTTFTVDNFGAKKQIGKYDLIAESKKIYNWLKTGK